MTGTDDTCALQRMNEEASAWRELPFVRHVRDFETLNWEVPSLAGFAADESDKPRMKHQEEVLGYAFAMELIAHIQTFPTFLPTRFDDVCEAIVRRGSWGNVERSFFSGVGEYLATSRVSCHANGWTSRPEATHRPHCRDGTRLETVNAD